MITHHTQLLQALIDKHGLQSYLEIGLQNADNNFNKIKSPHKCSVDPDPKAKAFFDCTSDQFFKVNHNEWDLIFLDGDHTADQVKRDFENSLRCLSDNGFIVIHDVLPENEEGTLIPRQTKKWWGTVYKFAMTLHKYDDINFITYNIDEGCCVIRKNNSGVQPWLKRSIANNGLGEKLSAVLETDPDWTDYLIMRTSFMNVVDEVII